MRKFLTQSVVISVASFSLLMVPTVFAEKLEETILEDVVVEADKDYLSGEFVSTNGSVGILGEKNVMDVPFTQVNLTQKAIESFGGPNQPLSSILVNNPSVRSQGTVLHNDFSIRGIKGNGTSSYLNGIPGLMTQFNAPTFMISDIQFIAGPNSGITGIPSTYETSAAGGIVNFVSKKATTLPITKYTQIFSGKGSFGEYFDIGRRFGKEQEWGVRLNTEVLNGETSIDGASIKARGIFANIDRQAAVSKSNLLIGYRNLDIERGIRWFTLDNNAVTKGVISKIPDAPNAGKDFGFPGMGKETEGYLFALNHEQNVNDNWKVFVNAGLNDNKLKKNITGQGSKYTIKDSAGNFDLLAFSTQTVTKNIYSQLGITGELKTGNVEHNLTAAVDKAWHTTKAAKNMYSNTNLGTGNIYTGVNWNGKTFPGVETGLSSKDQYWGLSFADIIKYEKTQFLLGLHKHAATVNSYNKVTGMITNTMDSSAVCPTYGIVYQPNKEISLYASHSENFDRGTVVDAKYENRGDILDPAKTKQNELGIKYKHAGLLTTISFFDINQANNIEVVDNTKTYLRQNGKQNYKGTELSFNGRLADKWNIMGGVMYLDAKQVKTKGGTLDGKTVNGVAEWNNILALEYNASTNFSVFGRSVYTGTASVYDEKLKTPDYVTFDLGVKYKTKINTVPVTFSAVCYNLTDKDYWTAYGNNLLLSNPRTIMLSAQFDI